MAAGSAIVGAVFVISRLFMSADQLSARAPLSVIVPALNSAAGLPACLSAIAGAAVDGLIREVIVSDGGSTDETAAIADAFGARFLAGEKGRGVQLRRGAEAARGAWLLFLHSDTGLAPIWADAARAFIEEGADAAGVFRLAFDAKGVAPRLVAWGANVRTRLFCTPYGDQGLLISRDFYERLGGYRDYPLFEDVDLVDRIIAAGGRRALRVLPAEAITSAARYERSGYMRRVFKNMQCLALYRAGRSPEDILRFYQSS